MCSLSLEKGKRQIQGAGEEKKIETRRETAKQVVGFLFFSLPVIEEELLHLLSHDSGGKMGPLLAQLLKHTHRAAHEDLRGREQRQVREEEVETKGREKGNKRVQRSGNPSLLSLFFSFSFSSYLSQSAIDRELIVRHSHI